MKYERFGELPVWRAAADLAAQVFEWTVDPWFRGKGDLANQLQRATLSVSNNIAEGYERGSTNELLQFLYYARGSSGEVRSMLAVIQRMDSSQRMAVQIGNFREQCEGISRQISGSANHLQNTDITGQRHLNDKSKQAYVNRQRRETFLKNLDAINEANERQREAEQAKSREKQADS